MVPRWMEWVAHRFGLDTFADKVLHRRVPRTPWYYGDGATLMLLFVVQVVTGMLLSLTYSPTPDTAYESVQYLTYQQMAGGFIRALHYWSAGLMVVMLFVHLFRLILVAAYKTPREGTWLVGVVMSLFVLAMSYTGYLLRWDERAVYGIKVALHILQRVPLIGDGLVYFVQGGTELGARTLTRFYSIHVLWMPLILLLLVAWHMYLVIIKGITSPAERKQPVSSTEEHKEIYESAAHSEVRGQPFYPDAMFESGAMAMVVFGIALVIAYLVGPPELYPEANFVATSYPAEEWWFWWFSALVALMPPSIAPSFALLFPIAIFLILILLPLVDRSPERGMRKRPIAVAIVVLCILALLYLTDLRRRSPWTGWPDATPPPVPAGVTISADAERGRILFAQYGCTSCHAVSGEGRQVGSDLARLERRYSREEIRAYTLHPPRGISMPSYEGRISEEDLELVVDFVHVAQTFPRK